MAYFTRVGAKMSCHSYMATGGFRNEGFRGFSMLEAEQSHGGSCDDASYDSYYSSGSTECSMATVRSLSEAFNSTRVESCASSETQEQEEEQPITTVMMRNIPCRCTVQDIISHLNDHGMSNKYVWVNLPQPPLKAGRVQKRQNSGNQGYCFVTLKEPRFIEDCIRSLTGTSFGGQSLKRVEISIARVQDTKRREGRKQPQESDSQPEQAYETEAPNMAPSLQEASRLRALPAQSYGMDSHGYSQAAKPWQNTATVYHGAPPATDSYAPLCNFAPPTPAQLSYLAPSAPPMPKKWFQAEESEKWISL
eukprot:TRINITY_DN17820_c0_g1_i1.p1 TRINITY_DN17820_c0_g1~~TRINITY_DN17820_c0_g1_i1.p1  ORF type:complete len:329 (+),score=53.80 TRINITY_DN17820_c0_g1_i1:69-989(+)